MIQAHIVKDSIAPSDARLTTFVLVYPRYVHSEFMTHRVFSRNASSSRAIPVSKQIQAVVDCPAIPLAFTKNQKGMQGGQALSGEEHSKALAAWLEGRDRAVEAARALATLEVHKQYANRVLEPYAHITVVCTATDYANFFALRYHPAAQPEICELAKVMYQEYTKSCPRRLQAGQWHLPFVDESPVGQQATERALVQSVARCARVSYNNHDGTETTFEQDHALYQRLLGSTPIHASPAEHQAMAVGDYNVRSGNLTGFIQYRKTLTGENIVRFYAPGT